MEIHPAPMTVERFYGKLEALKKYNRLRPAAAGHRIESFYFPPLFRAIAVTNSLRCLI
jgi:hypothetical protein